MCAPFTVPEAVWQGVQVVNHGPDIVRGALHIEGDGMRKLVHFSVGPFDVRVFLLSEHVPAGLRCSVRIEGPCTGWLIERLPEGLRELPLARVGA